ncbi:MAG TPA: hypothetical protein VEW46_01725 [Pyrinomonadaceae bacterium]|nr:hypothetical protein [Pyrinomonadaceae bacterium]
MKRSALKASNLALVPSAQESTKPQQQRSEPPVDYFDGWLSSVATDVVQERRPAAKRALTLDDIIKVSRSTIREGSDHRHWPPDVVRKFLVAEVINRKSKADQ